jgi:putative cell wall-binding protein
MGDVRRISGLLAVVVVLVVPMPATALHIDDAHVVVTRVAGVDRIDTAIRLADHVSVDPLPCVEVGIPGVRCEAVVIAQAGGYADALAGGPLASTYGSPILLSHPDRLPESVAETVRARESVTAWVLGGHAVLSSQVEDDLRAAGVDRVIRIAGTDRFDTARKIALSIHESNPPSLGQPSDVFIAAGSHPDPDRAWADALAAGALAGRRYLLLVEHDRLPEATREALEELDPLQVTIIGGTAAVSEHVEAQLRSSVERVERIAGADRYETAWLAAQHAVAEGASGWRLWLATGQDWPDALAAAPAISASPGVLLLTHPHHLGRSVYVRSWVDRYRDEFEFIRIIGGLGAVRLTVEDELRRDVEPCHEAYPDVCIGPPPPQLSCDQIGYRDFAVVGDDPHGFDRAHNGRACPSV